MQGVKYVPVPKAAAVLVCVHAWNWPIPAADLQTQEVNQSTPAHTSSVLIIHRKYPDTEVACYCEV